MTGDSILGMAKHSNVHVQTLIYVCITQGCNTINITVWRLNFTGQNFHENLFLNTLLKHFRKFAVQTHHTHIILLWVWHTEESCISCIDQSHMLSAGCQQNNTYFRG